jgi:hypothetical protein
MLPARPGSRLLDVCQELGYAVAQTMPHSSRSVVIIASTDMTPLMPGCTLREPPPAFTPARSS